MIKKTISAFFILFNCLVVIFNLPENIILKKTVHHKIKNFSDKFYPQSWNFFAPMPIMSNENILASCELDNGFKRINLYDGYVKNVKKIKLDIDGDVAMSFRTMNEVFITDLINQKIFFCKNKGNCSLGSAQIENIPSLEKVESIARDVCRSITTLQEFSYTPIVQVEYAPLKTHSTSNMSDEFSLFPKKAFKE
jgi:hypothetical protein